MNIVYAFFMLSFRLNRHSDLSMLAHRLIDFKIYILSARTLDEYFFFLFQSAVSIQPTFQ